MNFERPPQPEADAEREARDEWWRVGDSFSSYAHPDSPAAKERSAEAQALARIESELATAETTDRHELAALRERRSALEVKRAIRELVTFGGLQDAETRAALRDVRRLLDESAPAFESPDDLQ